MACSTLKNMPSCYIRIDVAHFVKSWSVFLKKHTRPRIKEFFLSAIGMLIVCQELEHAKAIVKSIVIISCSETIGDGTPTLNTSEKLIMDLATEEHTSAVKIKSLIDKILNSEEADASNYTDLSPDEPEDIDNEKVPCITNFWREWGTKIKDEALEIINREEGDKDNPRFCPHISQYLIKKIETIPLWGNVCRNAFGYGRVPATSAPVEGEFNLVKTHILQNKVQRVDLLIQTLIQQDKGRLAILEEKSAVVVSRENSTVDETIDNDGEIECHSQSSTTACPVCSNGDFPSEAHKCIVCSKNVHVISGCSVSAGEEEGYGEKRVCLECNRNSSKHTTIALQAVENWKGKEPASTKKRLSRYLGGKKLAIKDAIMFKSPRKITILKNGSRHDL